LSQSIVVCFGVVVDSKSGRQRSEHVLVLGVVNIFTMLLWKPCCYGIKELGRKAVLDRLSFMYTKHWNTCVLDSKPQVTQSTV